MKIITFYNILLFTLFAFEINAQNTFITNPSLEGDDELKTLDGWETCKDEGVYNDFYNDPDFLEFFADDVYTDTLFNKDGETMCLLRARSLTYENQAKRGTYEHISTMLLHPFEKDSTYILTLWLVHVNEVHMPDDVDPDMSYPMRFQVFGADQYCTANEQDKLADTLVSNEVWERYVFNLKPTRNYNYIYFRIYWDDSIAAAVTDYDSCYNGIMFLDGATLEKYCTPRTEPADTLYFKTSPYVHLEAPYGIQYEWEPEEYLSQSNIQSPLLIEYNPDIKVVTTGQDYCAIEKNYKILFSCDTLYPDSDNTNTYYLYYKFYEDVYLHASYGVSYNWNNSSNLSSANVQSPRIIEYDSLFNVTITDKYNCEFNEKYHVLLHCDSLYLSHQDTHFGIKVNYGEPTGLAPETFVNDITTINSILWSPSDNLSCTECVETELTPYENEIYVVEYTDNMNCTFKETFIIDVAYKIPNVITPGEVDGKNDRFVMLGLPENSSIKIFNKTGRLVFEANSYNEENWWDGTILNTDERVATGNYWYAIEVPGNEEPITGYIMVVW